MEGRREDGGNDRERERCGVVKAGGCYLFHGLLHILGGSPLTLACGGMHGARALTSNLCTAIMHVIASIGATQFLLVHEIEMISWRTLT